MANYIVRVTCHCDVPVLNAKSVDDALEQAMEEPDFGDAESFSAEIAEHNFPESNLKILQRWADYIVEND